MAAYIARRILLMIPTLFGIMLVTFIVTQFVPGGPVERMMAEIEGHSTTGLSTGKGEVRVMPKSNLYQGAQGLDNERLEKLRALYGFDKPPVERFLTMMKNFLVFDFGTSYYHHKSVVNLVISKLPVSMSLGLWTFLIVYCTCIPLGIYKAMHDGSRMDVMSSTVILIGYAIPGFVLAILLIVLFGGGSFWNIFPLRGLVSDNWSELSLMSKMARTNPGIA